MRIVVFTPKGGKGFNGLLIGCAMALGAIALGGASYYAGKRKRKK